MPRLSRAIPWYLKQNTDISVNLSVQLEWILQKTDLKVGQTTEWTILSFDSESIFPQNQHGLRNLPNRELEHQWLVIVFRWFITKRGPMEADLHLCSLTNICKDVVTQSAAAWKIRRGIVLYGRRSWAYGIFWLLFLWWLFCWTTHYLIWRHLFILEDFIGDAVMDDRDGYDIMC